MADAPQEKLSYSRGVLEKIRASYDKLSRDELLDLLCYVSKTYIVEQTIPFDVPLPERDDEPEEPVPDGVEQAAARADPDATPARRFARLIEGLKKRSQLPQLEQFTIEDGRAILTVDNQKIIFGERVTVEFVPTRGRPRPSTDALRLSPAAETPGPEPVRAPAPAPRAPVPANPPGARPDLPGGDGRTRQAGGPGGAESPRGRNPSPFAPETPRAAPGAPAPSRPAPAPLPARGGPLAPPPKSQPGVPKKDKDQKSADLTDVDHIVERFRRLDLD